MLFFQRSRNSWCRNCVLNFNPQACGISHAVHTFRWDMQPANVFSKLYGSAYKGGRKPIIPPPSCKGLQQLCWQVLVTNQGWRQLHQKYMAKVKSFLFSLTLESNQSINAACQQHFKNAEQQTRYFTLNNSREHASGSLATGSTFHDWYIHRQGKRGCWKSELNKYARCAACWVLLWAVMLFGWRPPAIRSSVANGCAAGKRHCSFSLPHQVFCIVTAVRLSLLTGQGSSWGGPNSSPVTTQEDNWVPLRFCQQVQCFSTQQVLASHSYVHQAVCGRVCSGTHADGRHLWHIASGLYIRHY